MKQNKRLNQFLIPLITALILIAFIFCFPNFSRICEFKAYDLKLRLTARLRPKDRAIADKIKIIYVADSTINQMGWPKQADHARLIDILSQHKAALIAYDWIFHEPDEVLIQAVEDSGRVLWPVLFDLSQDRGYAIDRYSQGVLELLRNSNAPKSPPSDSLWHTTGVALSHPRLMQHAISVGHISARNEEGNPRNDGIFRKIALVVDFAGVPFPSLALALACNYLQVPLNKIQIIPGQEIILPQGILPDTGNIKDIHIPINEQGEMWINFPGRWEDNYFEPFWFENVLDKHKDQSRWPEYDRKFSKDICLIGNASGKGKDVHNIPLEDNFVGVGIQAAALFTILSESFIHFSRLRTWGLTILILALLMGVISHYKSPVVVLTGHLLLLAGYLFLDFFVFDKYRLNMPTVFPVITMLTAGTASLAYHFVFEHLEKERLLKRYAMISLQLQRKEQYIKQVNAKQEKTVEKLEELNRLKREMNELLDRRKRLEMVFRDIIPQSE